MFRSVLEEKANIESYVDADYGHVNNSDTCEEIVEEIVEEMEGQDTQDF